MIIVTYNGSRWIRRCLDSIYHEDIPTRIYIVDNGSTDDTLKIIAESYQHVCLTISPRNLGFGQGNNLAISTAIKDGMQYFFLLNQDAWFLPGSLASLYRCIKAEPEFGIISPVHLNGAGTNFDDHFFEFLLKSDIRGLLLEALTTGRPERKLIETHTVNAAAWLVSLECIKTVGGFDPIFFHYGEDDNYLQRTRYKKLKIGILPDSYIIHDKDRPAKEITKIPLHKRIYSSHIQLLVYACDPNSKDPVKLLFKNSCRHLAKGLASIVSLKFPDARYHLTLAARSILAIRPVVKSREKNKSDQRFLHLP